MIKKKIRWCKLLMGVCLVASFVLLGKGSYMYAKAELAQYLIASTWQNRDQFSPPSKPWPWADIHAVATLEIPELGKKHYVMNEASGEALAFGPGYFGSNTISGDGHVFIAGHRDSHFEFLQNIELGHTIETEHYRGRTARYKVIDISVIDSNIEELSIDSEKDLITLVTCFPFNQFIPGGPLRYIVTGQAYSSLNQPSVRKNSSMDALISQYQTKPNHTAKPPIIQERAKTRQTLIVSDQPLLVSK